MAFDNLRFPEAGAGRRVGHSHIVRRMTFSAEGYEEALATRRKAEERLDMATTRQELSAFRAMSEQDDWITSTALAEKADVNERTARSYLGSWVSQGWVEVMVMSPAHLFRTKPDKEENEGYDNLRTMAEMLGM